MADRYVELTNSGLLSEKAATVASLGAASAGKIPALDAFGRLDNSLMPTGIAADTKSITSSENLAAGDLVNIFNDVGEVKCRKADASGSNAGKIATGYVLSASNAGESAIVYFEGTITGLSGMTPGTVMFLSGSSPGTATPTAPVASGYSVQTVGVAVSTNEISFEPGNPVVRG